MTSLCRTPSFYFVRRGFLMPGAALPLLAIRALLFITILVSWYYVFSLLPDHLWAQINLQWSDLVWYVTIAEIGTFTVASRHKEIEYQLREGYFQSHLTRPMSWLSLWSWQEMGECMMAMLAFGVAGAIAATIATGYCAITPAMVPFLLAHLVIGSMIWLMIVTCIGLSTIWLGSSYVPFWVAQKLSFVLGGMIIPLHLYPQWLETIAYLTPFPAILAIPGQMMLPGAHENVLTSFGYQLLVFGVCYGVMRLMWWGFVRKLLREG